MAGPSARRRLGEFSHEDHARGVGPGRQGRRVAQGAAGDGGCGGDLRRGTDLRLPSGRAGRLGLFRRRRGHLLGPLDPRPRGDLHRPDARRRHPLQFGALCASARHRDPRAAWRSELGPLRDRRGGTRRERLWRPGRPHLHGGGRGDQRCRARFAPVRTTVSPTCGPSPRRRSPCLSRSSRPRRPDPGVSSSPGRRGTPPFELRRLAGTRAWPLPGRHRPRGWDSPPRNPTHPAGAAPSPSTGRRR